jgi:hypothetical protein
MIRPKTPDMSPKTFTTTARTTLYLSQMGVCPWCDQPLRSSNAEHMSAHHRLLRSAGGTWDPANVIGLHPGCHNVQPRSVHQEPMRAYSLGFMIRTRQMTPAQIPFYFRHLHQWWLLGADGGHEAIPEALALELLEAAGAFTVKVVERPLTGYGWAY